MMKGKKHGFHPKSYPIPGQIPSTAPSRNQCTTNVIKGGTLQVPPKACIVRGAKSPTTNSKKVLELPTNTSPKLMALAKQPFTKHPPTAAPKMLKPEPNKSLKKSLSNNDIQIAAAPKPEIPTTTKAVPTGKPPIIPKRNSPSPTQQLKPCSPSRIIVGNKLATKSNRISSKGKLCDFQPIIKGINISSPTSSTDPPPWINFLYNNHQ